MSKVGRNDPCPCGSGKKAKHCRCGGGSSVTGPSSGQVPLWAVVLVLAVLALGVAGIAANVFQGDRAGDRPPARVWSTEHGHWHHPEGEPEALPTGGAPQPPGPAPEGQYWCADCGEWHDGT